jgi:hypothetical protein
MELSTVAAFAAAAISLATLVVTTYFTGRRERAKWAREALAEAFYDFIDVSYSATAALHQYQKHLWQGGDDDALRDSADAMRAQEVALRHAQTKIRLLAPTKTVNLADEVRFRVKDAIRDAGPMIPAEAHEQGRAAIAEARARLIVSAKRNMALPR